MNLQQTAELDDNNRCLPAFNTLRNTSATAPRPCHTTNTMNNAGECFVLVYKTLLTTVLVYVALLVQGAELSTTETTSTESQSGLDYFLENILPRGALAVFLIILLTIIAFFAAKCFNRIHDRTELRDDDSEISEYTREVLRERMQRLFGRKKARTNEERIILSRNAVRRWKETVDQGRGSRSNSPTQSVVETSFNGPPPSSSGRTANRNSDNFVSVEFSSPVRPSVSPSVSSGVLLTVPRQAFVKDSPDGRRRASDISEFSVELTLSQQRVRAETSTATKTGDKLLKTVSVDLKKTEKSLPSARPSSSVHPNKRPITAGKSRPITAGVRETKK